MVDMGTPQPNLEYVAFSRIEPARKTFFYQKTDGTFFACNEDEAAMTGEYHLLVGVSDGTTYREHIRKSGIRSGQMVPIEQARKLLQEAFEAELAVAKGKFSKPHRQNVHFDSSFPLDQQHTFVPPR